MTNSISWLRWAGSKWRALPALKSVLADREYDRYVDPFVGAGTVFFKLAKPVDAILSDSNGDLVSFYKVLKKNPGELWDTLASFPSRISRAFYTGTRKRFNSLPHGLQRAATFFFLNRTCFNGIYRVNQNGEFNTPIGSRRKYRYVDLLSLLEFSEKLQCAEIVERDFAETWRYARPGTLYYLDPPYTEVGQSRGYDRYSWPPFGKSDLDRLETFIEKIVARGAHVVISYSGAKLPWFVPDKFRAKTFKVYRSISSDGTRGDKVEVCAYKWHSS